MRVTWRRVLWLSWSVDPGRLAAGWSRELGGEMFEPTGAVWVVLGETRRRARPTSGAGAGAGSVGRSSGAAAAVLVGGVWCGEPMGWLADVRGLGGWRGRRAAAAGWPCRQGELSLARDTRGYLHGLVRGVGEADAAMTLAVRARPVGGGGEETGGAGDHGMRLAWTGRDNAGVRLGLAIDLVGERPAEAEVHACDVSGLLNVRLDESSATAGWADEARLRGVDGGG